MKLRIWALTLCFLAFAGITANAQTIGLALTLAEINESRFNNGAGVGVWLGVPLGEGKWQAGIAGSHLRSRYHYDKFGGYYGPGKKHKKWYNNRMSTATVFVTRELVNHNNIALLAGPAVSYSSIGVKDLSVFADRIFAGAWLNANYKLTNEFKIELILHPRFSPAGNDATDDGYDPYSKHSIFVLEAWIGASYSFGK